ncbi:MAG: NUDIX domain-containing protein [bacterium]|nr:NUDIX domain-containing protein [bacterium]
MRRQLPFSFTEFKAIYSKVPRLCVDLIIRNKLGILLTLRVKNGYVGQWHLPGSTVYYQEEIASAIKRIAKEELGIEVQVDKFLGYIEYLNEAKWRGFGYTVSLAFLCTSKNKALDLDDQVEQAQYFKVLPKNTISQQKAFIKYHKLI